MKYIITLLMLIVTVSVYSQSRFSKTEFSINAFRAPSIGAEFRFHQVSIHAGYYLTAFSGVTNNFVKTGLTFWFLPVGQRENPSSFYAGASYMRGLDNEYEDKDAIGTEVGFRWMIWKGLNLRLGAIAVAAADESLKINPAGGISYSFFFNNNDEK
ncbi:MAG: hypothetical protein KA479_13445 [Saprospiraceae bacterium]|nr:hypothetical protein [Saprospiraceae bacterium]